MATKEKTPRKVASAKSTKLAAFVEAAAPAKSKSQAAFDGHFTPEDERIELLVAEHEKAKANVKKATDKKTAAYDALKAEMREQGVDVYHCYKTRKKAVLAPEDAKVTVVDLKEDEPTPYRPGGDSEQSE
jgi:hypothetical protein